MNSEYIGAAIERMTKHLTDKGYKSAGKIMIKNVGGIAPEHAAATKAGPFEILSWATRNTVDMEGEVVIPDGADTSYFSKNRTLFVDHEYDIMKAVGKMRNMKMTPQGWLLRGALVNNPENPYRNQVQSLAEAGNIGMSIGFEVLDASAPNEQERKAYPNARGIIRAWKLLEVSYTAMPMNQDCQSDLVPMSQPEPIKSMRRVVIL